MQYDSKPADQTICWLREVAVKTPLDMRTLLPKRTAQATFTLKKIRTLLWERGDTNRRETDLAKAHTAAFSASAVILGGHRFIAVAVACLCGSEVFDEHWRKLEPKYNARARHSRRAANVTHMTICRYSYRQDDSLQEDHHLGDLSAAYALSPSLRSASSPAHSTIAYCR